MGSLVCEGHARLGAPVSAQIPGSQGPSAPRGATGPPLEECASSFSFLSQEIALLCFLLSSFKGPGFPSPSGMPSMIDSFQ